MVMMSVKKSGPRRRQSALMTFGFLGLPPDKLNWVNCSSGSNMTKSGPKTTLVRKGSPTRVHKVGEPLTLLSSPCSRIFGRQRCAERET